MSHQLGYCIKRDDPLWERRNEGRVSALRSLPGVGFLLDSCPTGARVAFLVQPTVGQSIKLENRWGRVCWVRGHLAGVRLPARPSGQKPRRARRFSAMFPFRTQSGLRGYTCDLGMDGARIDLPLPIGQANQLEMLGIKLWSRVVGWCPGGCRVRFVGRGLDQMASLRDLLLRVSAICSRQRTG